MKNGSQIMDRSHALHCKNLIEQRAWCSTKSLEFYPGLPGTEPIRTVHIPELILTDLSLLQDIYIYIYVKNL
jgi:hypothetical protein